MASALEIIQLSDDTTVGTFGEVLLVHFRGPTTASCTLPMQRARRAMSAQHPRFTCFAVVEPESPPPDTDARKALLRFFEQNGSDMDALILAFVAEGFRGAMVRSVASSVLDLMSRSRFNFPRHTVRSIEEATSIVPRHAPRVDPDALLAAVEELRSMPARGSK